MQMQTSNKLFVLGFDEKKDVRFYYTESIAAHVLVKGRITVCVINLNLKSCARGVAICSPRDQFVKKIGRAIALGRAFKALETKQSDEPIRVSSVKNTQIIPYQYGAALSLKELSLFDYKVKE
jgi:hypothetical protein